MNVFGIAWLLVFSIAIAPPADAASPHATVFPPVTLQSEECGSDQLRIMSWAKDAASTVCLTGQEVLTLAIPSCLANQQVVYDGSKYVCRSPLTIPTCTAEQSLSFNGTAYECKSNAPPPTCTTSQVLTYNSAEYECVERSDIMPSCTSRQFLTYNGSAFQCAENQTLTLPTCGTDQTITSDGTNLVCVTTAGNADCIYREPAECQAYGGCEILTTYNAQTGWASEQPPATWKHGDFYSLHWRNSTNNFTGAQCRDGVIFTSVTGH